MGILSWLILGLIAGFVASKLINKTGEGLVMDIVLGVVGAFVGGFILDGRYEREDRQNSFDAKVDSALTQLLYLIFGKNTEQIISYIGRLIRDIVLTVRHSEKLSSFADFRGV